MSPRFSLFPFNFSLFTFILLTFPVADAFAFDVVAGFFEMFDDFAAVRFVAHFEPLTLLSAAIFLTLERLRPYVVSGTDLELDLSAVTFLDSAGVRLLDNLVQVHEERGAGIRLVAPEHGVARFTLTLCAFRSELI